MSRVECRSPSAPPRLPPARHRPRDVICGLWSRRMVGERGRQRQQRGVMDGSCAPAAVMLVLVAIDQLMIHIDRCDEISRSLRPSGEQGGMAQGVGSALFERDAVRLAGSAARRDARR
jgi:hypothetical protein